MKRLAAVQLVGNAAALCLGYYWLGIGEARVGLLAWSFTVALVAASLFLWMHGAGLVYGRDPGRHPGGDPRGDQISAPFRVALRRLPALLAAAAVALLLYIALAKLQDASGNPAFRLASWLTLKLRKPVKPAAVLRIFNAVWWVVRWVIVPVLLRPWISAVAEFGWRGFAPSRLPKRVWSEWCLTPLLLLCALWLPFKVLDFRPPMSSFGLEMVSFLVRVLIAYLVFTGGLLAFEGMPLFTQRKTSVSP
jgi:hypothetical protein